MIDFRFDSGDEYNIFITLEGHDVGRISYDNLIPESLFENLTSDEDTEKVEKMEKPEEYMHLNYITIYDGYNGRGLFYEAMKKFEEFTREKGYKAITLFTSVELLPIYMKMGFAEEFYLKDVEHHMMIKEL